MCTSIFLLSLSVIFHVWLPNSTTGWTSALNSIIVNIRGNSKRFHKLMSRNRLLLPVMCTPHCNLGLRLRTQGSRLWCGTIIRYGFRVDLSEKCTTSCFYFPSNILDKQQYPDSAHFWPSRLKSAWTLPPPCDWWYSLMLITLNVCVVDFFSFILLHY